MGCSSINALFVDCCRPRKSHETHELSGAPKVLSAPVQKVAVDTAPSKAARRLIGNISLFSDPLAPAST